MPDTKISALTAASAGAAANEFAINEAGTSKKLTLAQIESYSNPIITSNSGAVTDRVGVTTKQVITSNNTDITTNTLATQLTATGMNVGWWLVEYFILWQSNVTTTGITFQIDHNGTAANSQWSREDIVASSTSLATVGISNQANSAIGVTGGLPSNWSVRSDNAALGPNAGVDVINVNLYTRITGMLLVTVTGSLLLQAASEVASTTTRVVAGTNARYTRLS